MMQRRLSLAQGLLKPDGAIIIMIDENEVHRLSLLMEQMFLGATHYMVTIVVKPNSNVSTRLSTVEEYALFCFFGDPTQKCRGPDDFLEEPPTRGNKPASAREIDWQPTRKSGANSTPAAGRGLCYPVGFDAHWNIVGTGETVKERRDTQALNDTSLNDWLPPPEAPSQVVPGARHLLWPRKENGALARWVLKPSTLRSLAAQRAVKLNEGRTTLHHLSKVQIAKLHTGEFKLSPKDTGTGPLMIQPVVIEKPIRTVWRRTRHNAGIHGTTLLKNLLGEKRFDNPKSLYCTLDAISTVIADRPDAVVLDFFAGSGTTLHAVAALNAADNGHRQCVLVTHNELKKAEQEELRKTEKTKRSARQPNDTCSAAVTSEDEQAEQHEVQDRGYRPGDPEWEARGVFQRVTKPRVEAALTGRTPNGDPVSGKYLPPLYERPIADGLPAAATFFRLKCLDPDLLEMRNTTSTFDQLHPLLWAASGGYGSCPSAQLPEQAPPWLLPGDGVIPPGCRYGVLLDEAYIEPFCRRLVENPTITHVWVDSHSEGSARELRNDIRLATRRQLQVAHLYDDILSFFSNRKEP